MRNPYEILGVKKNAGKDDIKKAYRTLARDLHPDRHPGDRYAEEAFKDVTAAYDLLSDPDKRARFDNGEIDATGQETGRRRGRPGGFGGGFGGFGYDHAGRRQRSPFEDFFRNTGPRGAGVKAKGANVEYTLSVDFKAAAQGAKRRVSMTNGKHLYVTIPAGTKDGQTLRLKSQGMPGIGGGPAGDALVQIKVKPDETFETDGQDVTVTVDVSLDQAVLGGKVDVPTLSGTVAVTIPANSNSGTKLRLKGRGVQPKKGDPGDQYVVLRVMLPEKPDKELADFVKKWRGAKAKA